jgi:hypothetical protein
MNRTKLWSIGFVVSAAAAVFVGEAQLQATGHGCGGIGASLNSGVWTLLCSGDDCPAGQTCRSITVVISQAVQDTRCWCARPATPQDEDPDGDGWVPVTIGTGVGMECLMRIDIVDNVQTLRCVQKACPQACGLPIIGIDDAVCPCD